MVQEGAIFIHQADQDATSGTGRGFDIKPGRRGEREWRYRCDRGESPVTRVDGELVIHPDVRLAESRDKDGLHQTSSSRRFV